MNRWLDALLAQDTPAVLVTVADAAGSVPREAGAKMLVTATAQFDTIGGGHLELCACDCARDMLRSPDGDLASQRRLQRVPLGPTLGQCCGGVVWLAFERIDAAAHDMYATLQRRLRQGLPSRRVIALDRSTPAMLDTRHDAPMQADVERVEHCHIAHDECGERRLIDPCLPHCDRLYLFGAGHVGAALVRALAELPCQVVWIDEREDLFPPTLPANVSCEVTDTPEVLIEHAPAGASFLVMTHSHALDQQLAECILRRRDTGWFGLIGSHTKRIQFERRLRQRGIPEQRLTHMVCPIGIGGIDGKEPATIAIAVAAQLLQVWQRRAAAAQPVNRIAKSGA